MTVRTAVAAICLFVAPSVFAQFYTITDGTVNACTGALLDSGGQGAGGYSNNENHTLVVCPDGSGPAISLQWITFTLSTAGVSPVDQLSIYDGNSTSAPLIGTWTGTDSPGIVSASFGNPTGCLTLVFTSNNTGTGVFAAAISCFQPCEPPVANATFGGPVPLLACQGEVITFDGSASTAAAGFSVDEYRWDFADGNLDSLTGAVVTHAFPNPGEYVVQLQVTDDNGCVNTNMVDLQVLVSTTPVFSGTTVSPLVICEGESVNMNAAATPVMWSALPESSLGGGIFLPDNQGVPFSTSITFNNFAPGQTLTNINDLLSVCVDMEHSFIGDLVISLTCPSGQSVTFHQQGGGGTFLGVPVDNDSQPNAQGTCWNYCWSPTATNGTWVQNAGGTLPSGTYSSLNSMSALQGCQLNGAWTFTVVDLWASDNGFICNWGLDFNPALFPSLTQFTPALGTSTPDSAHWSGNGYVPNPGNPLTGTATPVGVGSHNYVFTVTDNFGCTYDTTITVIVNPGIQGPIIITGDQVVCDGGVAYLNAPPGYTTYNWSNGSFGPNISGGPGTYIVTVALGDCSLPSEPFVVTEAESPTPVITGPNFSCAGQPVVLSTTEPYATYLWSNGVQTATNSAGTGSYTVTVASAEGCTGTSAPFNVLVGNTPTAGIVADPASPQNPGVDVEFQDASNGNGSQIVSWEWSFGEGGAGSSQPNVDHTYNTPGTYLVTLVVTTAEGCVDTVAVSYVIRPEDVIIPNVFSPNGDGVNDLLVFENLQYYQNHLSIFNRWGQEVFTANNYRNNWRASGVPDGTYFFVLHINDDGREFTGHVTILR